MRVPQLVTTVTAALIVGIATLTLGLFLGLAAVPTVSPFGPPQADAAPTSSGTFTVEPATGSDVTVIKGVTNGTCDVPGTKAAPVDGYNAVVLGPGGFGPLPDAPHGVNIVSTSDIGFSTTNPIPFVFRTGFQNLAQELGTTVQPGDYVVAFRCVNQFEGVIYQTFSATLTFTGGPPATAFVVTNSPPTPSRGSPLSPSLMPTPGVTTSGSTGASGAGTGTGTGGPLANGASVVTMVTVGLALGVVLLLWRRSAAARAKGAPVTGRGNR